MSRYRRDRRLTPTAQASVHAMRTPAVTIARGSPTAPRSPQRSLSHRGCLGGEGDKTWFEVDAAAETIGMDQGKHWVAAPTQSRARAENTVRTRRQIVAGNADGIPASSRVTI